jgi:AcrR family transcriptional regulator
MSVRGGRGGLLDVAAEVLVSDPAASLYEVARAAGIGRTTLHKHYATRDELLYAVAHRAIDLWERAVAAVVDADDSDGGLQALAEAMIPIAPQLAFLWRTPAFDHVLDIDKRWRAVEAQGLAVLRRVQARGIVRAQIPDFWLQQTFYSLIYVAGETVRNGKLAPADAPNLVLTTFRYGLGPYPASSGGTP